MKKTPKKKGKSVTTDELAVMVQKGFTDIDARMATRSDIADMATKGDLANMATKKDLAELQENIEDSMSRHIKTFRNDYDDLAFRVKKLEHKVFEKR